MIKTGGVGGLMSKQRVFCSGRGSGSCTHTFQGERLVGKTHTQDRAVVAGYSKGATYCLVPCQVTVSTKGGLACKHVLRVLPSYKYMRRTTTGDN
jgi:hypothetical protein